MQFDSLSLDLARDNSARSRLEQKPLNDSGAVNDRFTKVYSAQSNRTSEADEFGLANVNCKGGEAGNEKTGNSEDAADVDPDQKEARDADGVPEAGNEETPLELKERGAQTRQDKRLDQSKESDAFHKPSGLDEPLHLRHADLIDSVPNLESGETNSLDARGAETTDPSSANLGDSSEITYAVQANDAQKFGGEHIKSDGETLRDLEMKPHRVSEHTEGRKPDSRLELMASPADLGATENERVSLVSDNSGKAIIPDSQKKKHVLFPLTLSTIEEKEATPSPALNKGDRVRSGTVFQNDTAVAGQLKTTYAEASIASDGFESASQVSEKIQPLSAQMEWMGAGSGGVTSTQQSATIPPGPVRMETLQSAARYAVEVFTADAGKAVEISLGPEELGRVRMSLVASETGMNIAISAERPETLDLLRRNIDLLSQEFLRLGYEHSAFEFSEEDPGHNAFSDNDANMSDLNGNEEVTLNPQMQQLVQTGLDLRL